jgi:hypothetical protein
VSTADDDDEDKEALASLLKASTVKLGYGSVAESNGWPLRHTSTGAPRSHRLECATVSKCQPGPALPFSEANDEDEDGMLAFVPFPSSSSKSNAGTENATVSVVATTRGKPALCREADTTRKP